MTAALPWLFALAAGSGLAAALYFTWRSLRAAFGAHVPEMQVAIESHARQTLLERKQALLASLSDLKFERDAGKVSAEDFEDVSASLRAQAKTVLRLLDEDVEPFRDRAKALLAEELGGEVDAPYRSAAPEPSSATSEPSSANTADPSADTEPSTNAAREDS